jgi:hypothetical protein
MPKEVGCLYTNGGHLMVQLHQNENWNTDETVYYMKKEVDVESMDKVRKIHEITNHKSENGMLHAYRNAGKIDRQDLSVNQKCGKHMQSLSKVQEISRNTESGIA